MNKIILIGRLTRDAELKELSIGSNVANFTLAVDRKFKNKAGEREADFVNCQAWGKAGELIAKYTQKGSRLGVVGRLQIRTYDDKDGNRKWITEVVVDEFEFLDSKKDNAAQPKEDNLNDIDFHLMAKDDSIPF